MMLGLGFLLGCLFRFPLVPWSLSESNATIVGAALGAFIAVSMAAWIAQWHSLKKWRRTRDILLMLILEIGVMGTKLTIALTILRDSENEEAALRNFSCVCRRTGGVYAACAKGADRIERLMPSLCEVDPVFAIAAADALSSLSSAREAFGNLVEQQRVISYSTVGIDNRTAYVDRIKECLSKVTSEMGTVKAIVSGRHRFGLVASHF